MSERVLVAGATGGVGQLTVAKLLEKGFPVRILTRRAQTAQKMFANKVEVVVGDTRHADTLWISKSPNERTGSSAWLSGARSI